ncbi:DNA polymerase III subunit alpha [bacterium]|nr:DNA polymerase III subunit alpha [candidate division CSSED10-310 bacterium]
MPSNDFIHLNLHTCFSMLEGASGIESLVAAAARAEMPVLAVTDTDGLYGVVPFTRICREYGIRPIYGVELTEPFHGDPAHSKQFFDRRTMRHATLLARDESGYEAVCRIITERHLKKGFNWESSVAVLPESVYVLSSDERLLQLRAANRRLQSATRVELRHYGGPVSTENRRRLLALADQLKIRAVATNGVHFCDAAEYTVHRILCALRMNATIGTVPAHSVMPPAASLVTAAEMFERFSACPEPLHETVRIARECGVKLDLGVRRLPRFPVPGNGDAYRYLRGLALQGLSERYDSKNAIAARNVLERELGVIQSMQLADYFLICHDIIRFARSRGYPCLGRGSAANSIVSYCLYITHVDPIVHNLFFERFLNEQRTSLPDFDLDFGTEDREKVLDYIFSFYGRDRVAMIGTHVTFQVRSAFREVAIAQGLAKGEVDDFIKRLPHIASAENLHSKLATSPETRSLPLTTEPFASLHKIAERISGFPRHIGTHPCGLVITPEPLQRFMPLELGEKGLAVTQWTMNPVEEAGLLKIDILGQRGLEVISYTVKAVRQQGKPVPSDPKTFLTDARTREWLRNGRSIGCFYIESPAMISLIRQARCDDFECLTALSSIIRPGVSNYGGKNTYLRRHLKLEADTVLHPVLIPILRDTRGCLIYQEQVIRIASELAGLTLGEADDLRRLMSFKKNRKRLSDYRERFFAGCRSKDIPEPVIDEIYRQVDSFAGYAFCKAHSASFALESFESMFYKTHHPAEFMAAVLSGGGGYYGSLEYLEESRRLGLAIHPPCINGSEIRFSGYDGHLRVGLMQIKGLRESTAHAIVTARQKHGPFRDLPDLLIRVPDIKIDEARNLAKCGGMRSLGRTIPEILWGVEIFFKMEKSQDASGNLLEENDPKRQADIERSKKLWNAVPNYPDPTLEKRLIWELEILGMSPTAHPLRLFHREISRIRRLRPVIRSVDMGARAGQATYMLGWRIIGKKTRTKRTGEMMSFITFSDEWGRFEATFFPKSFEQNAVELRKGFGPFLLKGRVDMEFGVATLVVDNVKLMSEQHPAVRDTRGPLRQPEGVLSVSERKALYSIS